MKYLILIHDDPLTDLADTTVASINRFMGYGQVFLLFFCAASLLSFLIRGK